ncbi:MAG: hypothetical protein JNM84_01360 [Planctomycetes bacterium]|nr:hypothetical protein [Planctomycetota bacterium]
MIGQPAIIGTSTIITTPTEYRLYSGITKQWTVLPVANATLVSQANDYVIIQDGATIYGYSTFSGSLSSITAPSGTPQIVSGPASSSWVTIVTDGTQAWAFGAFHGRWETTTLSQPNPNIITNRLSALIQDGTTTYAVSAHYGTFVPVASDALAALQVVGEAEVATANSPGFLRAFSAQQNRWRVQPVPTTAVFLQDAEFAMAYDANQVWACSGITGALASYTASGPIARIDTSEGIAALQDGPLAVCYASGTGRFQQHVAPNASFYLEYHFAFVSDANGTTPFSALSGTFGSPILGSYTFLSNDGIGFAQGGGTGDFAYSPITNTWIASPVASPLAIELVRDAVILVRTGGYEALSARHAQWIPLSTNTTGTYTTNNSSSTFVARDNGDTTAHVFDIRLNRWASLQAAGPLTFTIARHTAFAHDGQFAYGFGQATGEWFTQPLTAPPTHFRVASSVGVCVHGSTVSMYSVLGSLCYMGRFPEFTQAINLGNTLRLHQVAAPGSTMAMLVGFAPAFLDLGAPLGKLFIDPTGSFSTPWPIAVGTSGLAVLSIPIPVDPTLRLAQVHFQNLVLPLAPAQPFLSSSVAPIVF